MIDLIKRAGGKVAEELDVYTDFLVLGVEPTRPSEPGAEAPETAQDAYREAFRVWQRYQDMLNKAAKYQILALNTTRFLALIGYDPQRKLD